MKDWFDSLESREQLFVTVGAFIVALAVVYLLLWSPLDRKHDSLTADVAIWQSSLTELRQLRARFGMSGDTQTVAPRGQQQSPIVVVDNTLRSRGLDRYRQRSQPTTSNGIRIEFENVAFDELVLWLGDLESQYGMHVQAANFSRGAQGTNGRVNASLTLERAL